MRRSAFITLIFCFPALNALCQSLEGKWGGSFAYYYKNTTQVDGINNWPISLEIVLNKDSSYTVYTEFKGLDADETFTNIHCTALFKMISSDSIFLQELVITKPKNGDREGLKKMHLKVLTKKEHLFMDGSFETFVGPTVYRGQVRFFKRD